MTEKISLDSITSAVAEYYGTTPAVIASGGRRKTYGAVRKMVCYIAYSEGHMLGDNEELAEAVGYKNGSTAMYGAGLKGEDLVRRNPDFAIAYQKIIAKLKEKNNE